MRLCLLLIAFVFSVTAQAADVAKEAVEEVESKPAFTKAELRRQQAALRVADKLREKQDKHDGEEADAESAYVPPPIPTEEQLRSKHNEVAHARDDAKVALDRLTKFVERAPGLCNELKDSWRDRLSDREFSQLTDEMADLVASLSVRRDALAIELQAWTVPSEPPPVGLSSQKRRELYSSYKATKRALLNTQLEARDEIRLRIKYLYQLRAKLYGDFGGSYTTDDKLAPLDSEHVMIPPKARRSM